MSRPRERLHRLRGGDGASLPSTRPDELWPDLGDLQPYWESFYQFATSELGRKEGGTILTRYEQYDDGTWAFRAETEPVRTSTEPRGESHAQMLVYESETDAITFTDFLDNSSWTLENAFGDSMEASSRL